MPRVRRSARTPPLGAGKSGRAPYKPLWERALQQVDGWLARQADPEGRLDDVKTSANEFGYDEFGLNLAVLRRALLPAQWVYRNYFRCEVFGIERVPEEGRVILVANHSGQLPMDGAMIMLSMLLEKNPPRVLRSMIEKWIPQLPFVSYFFARCGQIVGTPDNCRKLLQAEEAILVFPEGVRGIVKTYDKAYELQDFGFGFMRLALEMNVPLVPVAVVGAEEQAPSIANLSKVGRMFGLPALPITPTWPLLGPLGMLPYPVKYRIYYGEPLHFGGRHDDEDAVIEQKVATVKEAIAVMLERGLADREHIFW